MIFHIARFIDGIIAVTFIGAMILCALALPAALVHLAWFKWRQRHPGTTTP